MAFTKDDERRLAELLAKKRQAEQEKRNAQKRLDSLCVREFGCKASEVKEKLGQITYLMKLYGKTDADFPSFIRGIEEQAKARHAQNA